MVRLSVQKCVGIVLILGGVLLFACLRGVYTDEWSRFVYNNYVYINMRDHKEDIEKLKLSEHEKDVVRRINVWIAFERGTTFIWFVLAYLVFLGLALIFSGLIVLLSLRVKRLEHKIKGLSLLKGEESEEGA